MVGSRIFAILTVLFMLPAIVLANIIGEDNRRGLYRYGPQLKLSKQDINLLSNALGLCTCPYFENRINILTCGIIGFHSQVLTSTYLIHNKTYGRINDLSKCTFQNFSGTVKNVPLDLSEGKVIYGSQRPYEEASKAYMVARLKIAQPNIEPIPLVGLVVPHQFKDQDMIMVSGRPLRLENRVGKNEPAVQVCRNQFITEKKANRNQMVLSDCDATGSFAGSIHLTRIDGQLKAFAMLFDSGSAESDGLPYNGDGDSVSRAIVLNGYVLADIMNLYLTNGGREELANDKDEK